MNKKLLLAVHFLSAFGIAPFGIVHASTVPSTLLGELSTSMSSVTGNWTQMFPSTSPPPRFDASLAYDAADGYALLFGGFGSNSLDDTWKFSAGTWTQLAPPSSPSARSSSSIAYDAADGSVLLFGGAGGARGTWEFAAGSWNQLFSATSPSPRYRAPITYDAGDGYVLLFWGQDSSSQMPLGDTWKFGPSLRMDFSMISSPSTITLHGGEAGSSTITLTSLNGFAGTVNMQVTTSSPQLSCSLSSTSVTLGPSGNSSLTISCSGSKGTYTVTVTGSAGSLSHSTTLMYTILHGRRGPHS